MTKRFDGRLTAPLADILLHGSAPRVLAALEADLSREPRECEGCAFKSGAAANREPNNFLKAQLCALGALPFYCHDGQDWRDPESHSVATRREIRGRGIRICFGWKTAVGKLAREGHFREGRILKQCFAVAGLEALHGFLHAGDDAEFKAESLDRLKKILTSLNRSARLSRARSRKGVSTDASRATPAE